jgi:hypothetical protein
MKKLLSATLVAAGFATATGASPISVTLFPGSDLNNASSAFYDAYADATDIGRWIVEDFEDRTRFSGLYEDGVTQIGGAGANDREGEIFGAVDTNSIGTFTGIDDNGTGTGNTCQELDLNGDNCDNIAMQDPEERNGQGNTVPFGGNSSINIADTLGMEWSVDTGSHFNELVFVLRDPADQGATLTITAFDGTTTEIGLDTQNDLDNNELLLVKVVFGSKQPEALIRLTSSRTNDSFSFDGGAVNVVPLPAAGWMLLAGLGGLAAMKRRRKAA